MWAPAFYGGESHVAAAVQQKKPRHGQTQTPRASARGRRGRAKWGWAIAPSWCPWWRRANNPRTTGNALPDAEELGDDLVWPQPCNGADHALLRGSQAFFDGDPWACRVWAERAIIPAHLPEISGARGCMQRRLAVWFIRAEPRVHLMHPMRARARVWGWGPHTPAQPNVLVQTPCTLRIDAVHVRPLAAVCGLVRKDRPDVLAVSIAEQNEAPSVPCGTSSGAEGGGACKGGGMGSAGSADLGSSLGSGSASNHSQLSGRSASNHGNGGGGGSGMG